MTGTPQALVVDVRGSPKSGFRLWWRCSETNARVARGVPKVEGKMAINLMCAVLERGPDDLCEMAVMLALADGADKDSGETWPSHKTIARRARQTDRSVRNVLKRLRDGGWVTWEKRLRGNGSQASNVYILDLEKLGETPRQQIRKTPVTSGGKGDELRSAPPEPRSAPPRNPVPPPPEPRSAHAPEPCSALEPSQNKKLAQAHTRSGSNTENQASELDDISPFMRKQIIEGKTVVMDDEKGRRVLKPGDPEFEKLHEALTGGPRPKRKAQELVASYVHQSIGQVSIQPSNCNEGGEGSNGDTSFHYRASAAL